MKIGLAFDLKPAPETVPAGAPDDLHEEFDSRETIDALAASFRRMGHEVSELGGGRAFVENLLREPPDLVFNLCEGAGTGRSRESRVPAACELLGVPYCGSDPVTMGVCLDKDMARRAVGDADVVTPQGMLVEFPGPRYEGDFNEFDGILEESGMALPVIAKPAWEGSSKGIRSRCLITDVKDLGPTVVSLWHDYAQPVLVEEFIDGEEITVAIIGNGADAEVLGALHILPRDKSQPFVYSLEVKRDWRNRVDYACPPKVSPEDLAAVEQAALAAYEILGCRDFARLDFRLRDGLPYFLEANPLPGLNPETGDICVMAKLLGVGYDELLGSILNASKERLGLGEPPT